MRVAAILLAISALSPAAPPNIAPLLAEKCVKCHGDGAKLSNLDLTSRDGVLKGGKHGPAIAPGDAAQSRLYQYVAEGKMPPGQKLDEAQIQSVRDWINGGAPWTELPARRATGKWWAFQPPVKRTPPAGAQAPIDAFVLNKLQANGLGFNSPAAKATLIRRLAFDLTGLPPAAEDYALSYPAAVDKYLASPRYGERWARHWLDVVRFGETDGGEHNFERMQAWPYRDWVIESLNADKPYTQFIREQIAGDVLVPKDRKTIAATGFLVAGPWDQVSAVLNKDETLKQQARMDELDDMVTTTAHSFLALTVNCARCHDHKFDPIPTKDYYRMTAFFSGVGFGEREVASDAELKKSAEILKPLREEMKSLVGQLAAIEDPVRSPILARKYEEFDRQRAGEPRRIPINPVWNRNQFPAVSARHFRFVVNGQVGKTAPRLAYLDLLPANRRVPAWLGTEAASGDKPQILTLALDDAISVSEIRWASDNLRASRDGSITVYRFEWSEDGTNWKTLASSLDHTGGTELDLPVLENPELVAAIPADLLPRRNNLIARIGELQKEIDAAPSHKLYAAKPQTLAKAFLLERGNVRRQVEEVQPLPLSAVGGTVHLADPNDAGARRVALANWVASANNPLTARVIVNRIWYHHFGNGIVNTPSDFGFNGDRPSHPELLDWLAVSFMENGWSLKWLHRQILLSRTYQQSATPNEKAHSIDAGNRLLWHMPLKRMDAETLRDSILQATGNLDLKMGGPSFTLQKKGSRGSYIYAALDNDGPEVWRRAIYRFVVRGGERIMMDSLDCPDPAVATPQRAVSNTPVQALTVLNNSFVIRQAGLLAARLERESPDGHIPQIKQAYRILYGRAPTQTEIARDLKFLESQPLSIYCRVLFNSNEFVYVP